MYLGSFRPGMKKLINSARAAFPNIMDAWSTSANLPGRLQADRPQEF